jgi:hypothetical protein
MGLIIVESRRAVVAKSAGRGVVTVVTVLDYQGGWIIILM